MDQHEPTEAAVAFERLAAALAAELRRAEHEVNQALEEHDLANLDRARRWSETLSGLAQGVKALARGYHGAESRLAQRKRRFLGRLDAGLVTHRRAFRQPILQALADLGGSATAEEALVRVAALMTDVLQPVDFQPVPSRPHVPRWRNAAHSCRGELLAEGLLERSAPRGVWRLSPAGRDALRAAAETP